MNDTNSKHLEIITFILVISTVLLSVYRCLLGADIGDEALYIGDPLLVAHGATPYVNNWLQTPGFSFFLAPVVGLYGLFVPNHQGIFLFMRLFFLVVKVIVYIGICFSFRKSRYKNAFWLVSIPLIANFFGVIPSFNYTNIPLLGLLIVGLLLLYQWNYGKTQEIKTLPYISGVIMACITLCSPTQAVNCLVIMLLYYICIDKYAGRRYILGGAMTAVFFSGYMVIKAGSISGLIHSLQTFLKHPYFNFGASTLSWQAYQIFPVAVECMIVDVVCVFIMEVIRRLFIKKDNFNWSCNHGLVLGTFIGMIYILIRYGQYPLWVRVIILLSIGSFFFRFISGSTEVNRLFDFVAIPEIVTFLGMALTVYGGVFSRFYVFVPMALICLVYVYDILRKEVGNKCFYITAIYIVLFLIGTFKYELTTIYGEFYSDGQYVPVKNLTTRVDEGVYAGLYTTPEKAVLLQELESYIRANTSEEEYVLFMDRVPMAYLMTEAEPCSPTSWDPQLYSSGYREESNMLQDYFETVDRVPDKIIYVQTSNTRTISIEDDNYRFTQYVKQNYSLDDEETIENTYYVQVYSKE